MQPRKSTSSDPNISEKLGPKMASSASTVTDRFSTRTGGADIIGDTGDSSGPGPQIMSVDTLEGDSVVNGEGETLGEIKNIMIDVLRGRVAYAVLSFGGFLGMGNRLFAIPWSALTLDARPPGVAARNSKAMQAERGAACNPGPKRASQGRES